MQKLKEENEFYAQRGEDFARMADPTTGQPLLDAATAEKYAKGSLSQKKAIFADTMFKYTSGLKQQDLGMEQQRINIAGQHAETSANLGDRRQNLDEREFQQKTIDRNSPMRVEDVGGASFARVPGSANAFPLSAGTAAQPDGTIAKDANQNEIGVWQGGKLIKDAITKQWTQTGEQLVNSRTKRIVKPIEGDLPKKDPNDPNGGGPNNNPLLPTQGGYGSAEDVKDAVKAGKLDRTQALEILRTKFGLK